MEKKREACRKAQRNKRDCRLKDAAKLACKAFESAANEEKKTPDGDLSRTVTENQFLHKFWKLHKAMHGNRTQRDRPDFRREGYVWVRMPEEKGTSLLDISRSNILE